MGNMNTAGNELQVEGVRKHYHIGAGRIDVLRDVSMQLAAGESCAIMGPSGCGKSTLLNIIGGLEAPDVGTVRLGGEAPYELDDAGLARFRNRRVGFIFQSHHLLPHCSVLENVLVPTLVGPDDASAPDRARELLRRVGLADRAMHMSAQLSGGEQQRVAIARALINSPPLLLADEPTGNLDEHTAAQVADLLCEMQADGATMLIVVTHNREIAARFGRQLSLREGRLVHSNEAP